jgi:hypothetical protein
MSSDVARFYKDRAKTFKTDEKRFDYDEDGHMVERTKNDNGQYVVSKTIALPSYRPLHQVERDTMEQERQTAIAEATHTFETARRALYEVSRTSDGNEETIIKMNRAVQDAEYALYRTRFPLYGAMKEKGVQIRKLDPSQSDQRTLPYSVLVATAFPFALQDYYVREGEMVAPLQSVAEIQQEQQEQQEQKEPVVSEPSAAPSAAPRRMISRPKRIVNAVPSMAISAPSAPVAPVAPVAAPVAVPAAPVAVPAEPVAPAAPAKRVIRRPGPVPVPSVSASSAPSGSEGTL